ncbi:MAG TPA: hemolysin family protein, partial [Kofleriaceae bacterium]|nr:hemolysin family protein [Kofleriaceae bacterium]
MALSLLALGACLVLVLANAFFVASEFAIVKMRATRLVELAEAGNSRARTALGISRRLDAYLSANQLGITLASLALGWIGEPAFAGIIEPLFARLGPGAAAASHTVAVIVGFVAITFLHTVIGELAPKSLAIQRTEPVALWTAKPLRWFYFVAYPVIWTLNAASALTLRLLRLRPASESELLHSPEEMRLVLRHVAIDPGARRLIDRVFDYTRRVARHVMTLRRDVTVLEIERTFDENVARVLEHQYTRYPLVDPTDDRVL